jgi:UPF0755 protein
MTARSKYLILFMLIIIILPVSLAGFWMQSFITTAVPPAMTEAIEIKPGSSFTRIANQLEQAGVISDAQRFTLLARWREAAAKIHAGEYLFENAATPDEVLNRLIAGDIRKFQVTIPEGFNLKEIAARLARTEIAAAEDFLSLCYDDSFIKALGIEAGSLEGYLFPETYTYSSSTTAHQLLRTMVEQLNKQLSPALLKKAESLNLNRHELLTLASIIQKEAGNVMEMPLISAVFHNRLKRGIALQADPTVIYGIKNFDGNLTRKHLETPTAYNTYRKRGLPPGPIACPGAFALHAAANPAKTRDLYFVARGDGTHEFNETLKEHNRAVRRYQLKR